MTRPTIEDPKTYSDVDFPDDLLDPDAVKIIRRLQEKGEEALLVGGCVRDLLRASPEEAPPKDFDVITSAEPKQIRKLFRNSRTIGRRFKLVHVFWGQKVIEVTTFRAPAYGANDPRTGDGEMVFGDAASDALLRDFTINAVYYDPIEATLIDYVEGYPDLRDGLLRAIGDPDARIVEDPVRILRGIRYAAKLDLDLEASAEDAFAAHMGLVDDINASRLREEVWKFLKTPGTADSFEMLLDLGGFDILFPGLERWAEDGYLLADQDEKDVLPPERHDTGLLWAALFLGILDDRDDLGRGDAARENRAIARAVEELAEPLAVRHNIARRDRHVARALLEAIPKLMRGPGGRNRRLARRPFFPQALDLYELYCNVRQLEPAHLLDWQQARVEAIRDDLVEPEPEPQTRRRRRRRRRPQEA